MKAPTAVDYIKAGYAIVPIPDINGKPQKRPTAVGWNLEANAIRTIEQAERLNGCNIGLAHRWSSTCCWDIDDYLAAVAWLAKRGIELDDYLAAEDAVQISSGRENRCKLCFRLPDGVDSLPHVPANGRGFELRCASKDGTKTLMDVLPPSIHPDTGRPYMWKGDWRNLPELPAELLVLWRELAKHLSNGSRGSQGARERAKVPEGGRDNHLVRFGGSMRRTGLSEAAIYAALCVENQEWCDPPLPDGDVRRIARSVSRYALGVAREEPPVESYEEDARRYEEPGKGGDGGNGVTPPPSAGKGNGAGGEAKEDSGKGTSTEAEWPKPGDIAQELLPVPVFDPDSLLPEPLHGWIVDRAQAMPCPIEFVAVPAIVMAGSVIGARCGLRPKVHGDWVSIPNLWGGIIGGPGTKKSPALDAASRPLGRLIKEARAAHAEAMEDYDARKDSAEDAEEEFHEDAPTEKRYRSNDCTIEKLCDLLKENPSGLLVQRDELVGLIASWDRQGREQDRALYLESWNGYSDYWVDRIKRGSSYLPNLCLSVLGGIQPTKLMAYLDQSRDALADDGMLQRFQMLVYPDPVKWENVDRKPNTASLDRAYGVFKALADMVPSHWGAGSDKQHIKFPYFKFHGDAQAVFNDWHDELHRDRIPAEESPLLAQYLAKLDNLFLGLALIFHLVDIADTQIPRPGETLDEAAYMPTWAAWVSVGAVQRAKAWCDYLEAHARRIYGMQSSDELRAAQALAAKVRAGRLEDGFTVRDVIRARWHGLTTRIDIEAALAWLEEEGWLRVSSVSTGKKGGRPTTRYLVNPRVRDGAR